MMMMYNMWDNMVCPSHARWWLRARGMSHIVNMSTEASKSSKERNPCHYSHENLGFSWGHIFFIDPKNNPNLWL